MSRSTPVPNSLEAALRTQALGYPETVEEFPWGERVVKVRGKIFIFMRAIGTQLSFSMKLPRSAAEALELGYVEPTGYGLGKHGWVTAAVDLTREVPAEMFSAWLEESYRAVAPKAVVACLDAAGGAAAVVQAARDHSTRPATSPPAKPRPAPAKKRAAAKKQATTSKRARTKVTARAKPKRR